MEDFFDPKEDTLKVSWNIIAKVWTFQVFLVALALDVLNNNLFPLFIQT